MILKCSCSANKEVLGDVFQLNPQYLKFKSTHLFIASHAWSSVEIELIEDIPTDSLKWLSLVTKDIKVKLPGEVTEHILQLLIELFPDKAGVLRRTFLQNGSFEEVLGDCLVR